MTINIIYNLEFFYNLEIFKCVVKSILSKLSFSLSYMYIYF